MMALVLQSTGSEQREEIPVNMTRAEQHPEMPPPAEQEQHSETPPSVYSAHQLVLLLDPVISVVEPAEDDLMSLFDPVAPQAFQGPVPDGERYP